MPESKIKPLPHDPADAAAEEWFIRRDRGLTEVEQAAYLRWLQADPRHAAAMARVEKLWRALDPAVAGLPSDAAEVVPSRWRYGWWSLPLAAAAVIATFLWFRAPNASPPLQGTQAILHPGPERLSLPDGSVVEWTAGSKVEVQFTPEVRQVNLVRGTAFFSVAKNTARPFVVRADAVSVRAVGTAFSVAVEPENVSVLVTEGRVRVQETPSTETPAVEARELSILEAGEQGVAQHPGQASERWTISLSRFTPDQIERALAWRGPRLEFVDLPLAAVVAEFNRYAPRKLVVGDDATAAIRVGGNFRADRPESFLRALEVGFNISASPHGNEIILRRGSAR